MFQIFFLFSISPCVLATSTIPANRLFQNTLNRWGITIHSDRDRSERWNRFIKAKDTVDRFTTGAILESLNRFTVLNDREYEARVGPFHRSFNSSNNLYLPEFHTRQKRQYTEVDIPDSYTYWEDDVGLNTPRDQYGCGSCWSFPTVGAMEALYREATGEFIEFSMQYFVDCTFDGDGCGGGEIDDGFDLTMMRQYMKLYDDYPYWGAYTPEGCEIDADDITSLTGNAMTKMWFTNKIGLSTNENAMLAGLVEYSPVAYGSYVSTNIFDYSGGVWTDSSCSSDPNPHAMLLVGYTETYLRVKGSYGSDWGDGGYIMYERGTVTLDSCNFYKDAYAIQMTYRREIVYEFCSDSSVVTRSDCRTSCQAMDTETETGWDLALIPTLYHNDLLVNMINENWPGVKSNDQFNYLWMGLKDPDKISNYTWIDEYTPVQYINMTENVAKYGMLNKNTGYWSFKNSNTYEARGLCSRAATCWDIGSAVEDGEVTYDSTPLYEGTVATAACDSGYAMTGDTTLTCVAGNWDVDLPTCACISPPCEEEEEEDDSDDSENSTEQCAEITVDYATISPSQPVDSGVTITITCDSGYEISGSTELTCSGTSFDSTAPTCEATDCNEISVVNSILTADNTGTVVTVVCITGYYLVGDSELSCETCLDDSENDAIFCAGSSFTGDVPECKLTQGSCPGGTHYTDNGDCEECPANHWMEGGDSEDSGSDGCNQCPGNRTSDPGSDSEEDCRYTICTCTMLPSVGGKFRTSCACW